MEERKEVKVSVLSTIDHKPKTHTSGMKFDITKCSSINKSIKMKKKRSKKWKNGKK